MIFFDVIVIPNRKPRYQKEFIWRGQGYDCKWDFICNTKYNSKIPIFKQLTPPIFKGAHFGMKPQEWK